MCARTDVPFPVVNGHAMACYGCRTTLLLVGVVALRISSAPPLPAADLLLPIGVPPPSS